MTSLPRLVPRARNFVVILQKGFSSSPASFSGHNRWSKISHHKDAEDVKKSKLFSKAAHEIATAVKTGGSVDPNVNLALAVALRRAKVNGVPKDNISAALSRVHPSRQSATQLVVYEALGPAQTALIIECETDNTNRTIKNIQKTLRDHGSRIAPVRFMFSRVGRIVVKPRDGAQVQDVWDAAIEAGAEDVNTNPDESTREVEVLTSATELNSVSNVLSSPPHAHNIVAMELAYLPSTEPQEEGQIPEDDAALLKRLTDALEDDPDCVRVWTT
ncbi:transcriptional regulator TACO1-like protein [Cantharellus anzutake]|uniref:transcriptional regulator TACO1-like protein n=1 Tax=Cantharellus anzutake TaxID=1750568 RepID=UPI00190471A8|nr:transcriptional regulator TACO1-like protein [Cantharellus anzutake]KAF8326369.1 transcriptional regulator TACO1-like protein [Cantharellus anzutake]